MTLGADGYLRGVPSDPDVNDGRLYPFGPDTPPPSGDFPIQGFFDTDDYDDFDDADDNQPGTQIYTAPVVVVEFIQPPVVEDDDEEDLPPDQTVLWIADVQTIIRSVVDDAEDEEDEPSDFVSQFIEASVVVVDFPFTSPPSQDEDEDDDDAGLSVQIIEAPAAAPELPIFGPQLEDSDEDDELDEQPEFLLTVSLPVLWQQFEDSDEDDDSDEQPELVLDSVVELAPIVVQPYETDDDYDDDGDWIAGTAPDAPVVILEIPIFGQQDFDNDDEGADQDGDVFQSSTAPDNPPVPPPVVDDTVYGGLHKKHQSLVEFYQEKQRAERLRGRIERLGETQAKQRSPQTEQQKKTPTAGTLRYTALPAGWLELLIQRLAAELAEQEKQRIEEEDIVFVLMTMAALRRFP